MESIQNFNPMPRIGEKAPTFTADTTQGPINFPEDFNGKWIILFSHPADFTPVCTSEFVTFGSMQKEFERLNCQLIGLSIDGLASHIAWLRTIKEKIEFKGMKNIDVQFPLIEDISMKVANKYGMVQPEESSTKAVRAVFFIDPQATIRAIIYYPLNVGRNFDELKRVLVALQTTDKFKVAVPANWRPGDDVIIPAPASMRMANERMEKKEEGVTYYDWFFSTKKLPKETIEKEILKA
jgi:peroxiredoxin (alkyl hydroperoxide reductase subunit C)